jgi:hypothetical protein
MRRDFYCVSIALAVLLATQAARADSLSFTTLPNPGNVSGTAGSTVGWGYSITNDSASDYLDISAIDSDLFAATDGIPDASIFTFPNLAPGQTISQAYDPADALGLFQFTWNAGLPAGTTEAGQFTLYGAFCDPSVDFFCAEDGTVLSTALASAAYSATVIPSSSTPVPEPSSFLLLFSGLCGIGLLTRRSSCLPTSSDYPRQTVGH